MQNAIRPLAALAAAAILWLAPSPAKTAGEPYPIDVILPITGPGAFVGSSEQKVLTALENVVNQGGGIQGRPVSFVFHDDQTNPSVSVQMTNDAIAKKPAVILGPGISATCAVAAPLVTNGPVTYCFSPNIAVTPNGYLFSSGISVYDLERATIRYMNLRGWKRIASLNTTDASGQNGDRDIAAILKLPENAGMTLVAAEHFAQGDTSASAQLSRIKALNPQALIVFATGTAFGTALHGIQDLGIDLPVVTTAANMIVSQMLQYKAFTPKDVYFQGAQNSVVNGTQKPSRPMQVYLDAMKAAGLPPDGVGGGAWDPALIVVDALRKIGPNATAAQLHDYLQNLHGYTGISGTYDFRGGNQRGLTVNDCLIIRWDGGNSTFVSVSKPGGAPL